MTCKTQAAHNVRLNYSAGLLFFAGGDTLEHAIDIATFTEDQIRQNKKIENAEVKRIRERALNEMLIGLLPGGSPAVVTDNQRMLVLADQVEQGGSLEEGQVDASIYVDHDTLTTYNRQEAVRTQSVSMPASHRPVGLTWTNSERCVEDAHVQTKRGADIDMMYICRDRMPERTAARFDAIKRGLYSILKFAYKRADLLASPQADVQVTGQALDRRGRITITCDGVNPSSPTERSGVTRPLPHTSSQGDFSAREQSRVNNTSFTLFPFSCVGHSALCGYDQVDGSITPKQTKTKMERGAYAGEVSRSVVKHTDPSVTYYRRFISEMFGYKPHIDVTDVRTEDGLYEGSWKPLQLVERNQQHSKGTEDVPTYLMRSV